MVAKGANREQSERTREALVTAARALFAKQGFAATGTEDIVNRAGLTRGALYHHYGDKSALFRDVFEHVERDLMAHLAAQVAGLDDPIEMLRRSGEAFLDACLEPEVRQIALIDAPSVLGWAVWREVDARYGLGMLRMLLSLAADRGHLAPEHVDHLAHLILGAVSEAAMVVANHPEDQDVRERMGKSLGRMLERLLEQPAPF